MNLSPRSLNVQIKKDLACQHIKPEPLKKVFASHPLRKERMLPTRRIKARLELSRYERGCKFVEKPDLKTKVYHLLLSQHIGTPCTPQVKPGDKIKEGQIIADVDKESLGVPLHSPVAGVVTHVDNEKIIIQKT